MCNPSAMRSYLFLLIATTIIACSSKQEQQSNEVVDSNLLTLPESKDDEPEIEKESQKLTKNW